MNVSFDLHVWQGEPLYVISSCVFHVISMPNNKSAKDPLKEEMVLSQKVQIQIQMWMQTSPKFR